MTLTTIKSYKDNPKIFCKNNNNKFIINNQKKMKNNI